MIELILTYNGGDKRAQFYRAKAIQLVLSLRRTSGKWLIPKPYLPGRLCADSKGPTLHTFPPSPIPGAG